MQKQPIIYIDGKYLKVSAKTLAVFTPGVFKARGVFETMLAIGGRVLDADLHLKRLHKAFKGIEVSHKVLEEIVKRNGFDVSRLRVVAWRQGRQKHVAVMALKYVLPDNKEYKVCLIKTNRPGTSEFAHIKSLDYQMFADAFQKARVAGFDEALLINSKGYVFESSRANIFWLKNNKLYTPPLSSGCLKGITRDIVIQYAKKFQIPFYEKNLSVATLKDADNVFLTNSLLGIQRVKNFFPLLPR